MASRKLIFGSLLTPLALYFGGSMAMDHVDRQGWRFFNSGKDIVATLGSMAKAAKEKDGAGIESFYAPDYSGTPLGLNRLQQAEEKDGARLYRFTSEGGAAGRDAALLSLPKPLRRLPPSTSRVTGCRWSLKIGAIACSRRLRAIS